MLRRKPKETLRKEPKRKLRKNLKKRLIRKLRKNKILRRNLQIRVRERQKASSITRMQGHRSCVWQRPLIKVSIRTLTA